MGKNLPPQRLPFSAYLFCVDSNNNTLRSKTLRRNFYQIRVIDCRRINSNLVSTGIQHGTNILDTAYSTTHRQRNKYFRSNIFHGVNRCIATFVSRRYIKKGNFIGALLIVTFCYFNRITSIANINKVDTLNNAAIVDIKTRNNSFR